MTKKKTLSALLFLYLATFIFNTFFPSDIARYVMFVPLALVHFLAFGAVKRASKIIGGILTVLGVLLLTGSGAKADDWVNAWLNNAPVICLLLTVSLFTIPLYFEPYHDALNTNVARFAKSPFRFYALTLSLTTALASLLNVASLPFVHNLLKGTAARYPDGVVAKSLIRGTAVNMFWSPAFISLAIVIKYSGISWFAILPCGAALALAAYLAALAFGAVEFRGVSREPEEGVEGSSSAILLKLFLQMAIMMVFIALLQYYTGKSALVTVPLVSLTGPLLLALIFSRRRVFTVRIREYFAATLPNSYGEVILFTSFGFFGYALGMSEVKDYIPLAIRYLGLDTPLTLIPLITFLTTFPCLFGVHPLITISTVAIALPPGSVALTNIQMAGALLLGYVCYGNLSPFSAVNLVIIGLTKEDPVKASIRRNWPFALALTIATTVILTYLPF
jgi:hypothetical protein